MPHSIPVSQFSTKDEFIRYFTQHVDNFGGDTIQPHLRFDSATTLINVFKTLYGYEQNSEQMRSYTCFKEVHTHTHIYDQVGHTPLLMPVHVRPHSCLTLHFSTLLLRLQVNLFELASKLERTCCVLW